MDASEAQLVQVRLERQAPGAGLETRLVIDLVRTGGCDLEDGEEVTLFVEGHRVCDVRDAVERIGAGELGSERVVHRLHGIPCSHIVSAMCKTKQNKTKKKKKKITRGPKNGSF